MYELEKGLIEFFNNLINWFKEFFTRVAGYLLIVIVAIVLIAITYLIVKALFTRERYIEKGRKVERND